MKRGLHLRRGGVDRWVLPAFLLHVAAAAVVTALPRATTSLQWSGSAPSTSSSELVFVDEEWLSTAESELAGALSLERPDAPTHEMPMTLARAERARALPLAGAAASRPPRSDSDAAGALAPLPPEGDTAVTEGGDARARPERPALSLSQLGIGTSNPFRALTLEAPSPHERAEQRLRASLLRGSLDHDRQRALGPEGPVVDAARRVVIENDTLVDTSAVVNVRVNGAGRVTSIELLEASSHSGAWRVVAARLLKALDPITLRFPRSNAGLGLRLRLASALRLPSGAAPGLRTDLLGQTLSEGNGPGSASISLSPSAPLQREEVFDSAGRHMDRPMKFELGLLELKGDVADTVASARRVVQVTVLSVDTVQAPL